MKKTIPKDLSTARRRTESRSAFSLIELMVAMALLTFIVLGLLAMFNQTQKAFRAGLSQTDVLEGGRAVMQMITRQIEQAKPAASTPRLESDGRWHSTTNMFAEPVISMGPMYQDLPGNALPRTNLVQRFFLLTQVNQDWIGTGFEVVPDYFGAPAGTLYSFSVTNARNAPITTSAAFLAAYPSNFNRLMDGVVHLRLRAYDHDGRLLTWLMSETNYPKNTVVYRSPLDGEQIAWYCTNNATPGSVELELGILEPRIWQRYRAIGNTDPAVIPSPEMQLAQRRYLSNHVAQVHLFRQRVPLRNGDLSIYQIP